MKLNNTLRYSILGALFGLLFPIVATIYDLLIIQQMELTFANALAAQAANPLHWLIDTIPVLLGLFASFAATASLAFL